MTDRNVFLVVFRTPRGRLSETRGSSEGPVITELPDDYEVDNVKAVKGVNDSSNDSNDNIDTNTDVAANALVNDDNALNTNARAKPVENKQSGRAYTNLGAFEETAEKTNDQCTPKHEDGHTHFTLGFQFTTKDLPSNHPSNFIRSNDRDFKHVFTNEPTKHDTKELEIESPTGHESDLNDSSKPRVSANRNGTHLSTVSAYHPDDTHKPDASQDVAEAKKQNSWNATFSDNDHNNLSDRSQTEPFVFFGAGKPVTANDAHRIEAVTSKNGHSNQRENDEHIANCPKCFKQKYCQHKEIKEMRCCQGCCKLSIQCTSCKKKFSEEELLILTEKRSAKLNKNTIPRKSKRSFVESKEAPNKPSTKEKYPSTNSLDPQCLFDDLVASVGLTVRNVSADGNCMFTAVVDQLRIHGNFTYTPRMLRAAVVGFLRQNPQLDNDTHLQEFVEEPWEKYLDNMSQDGHWGDHIVIRGLANLLNTKIRIYRELYDGLNTTDTLPDNVKERSSRLENDIIKHEPIETDEATRVINLGHLFEMHYVSLRPQTWKEQLLKVLENECEGRDSTYPAGSANVFEVPTVHMSFALKYFARQKLTLPSLDMSTLRIEGQMHDCNVVHNEHHDVLYEYTSVTQRSSDMYNRVALFSPNDTFVISKSAPIPTEYRYYLQPVINTNTTVLLQPTEPTVWKRCLNDENFLQIMFPSRTPDDRLINCMAFFCEMPEHMSSQWMTRKRPHSWPSDTVVKDVLHKGFRLIPAPSVSSYDWQYDFRCAENIIVENAMNKEQKECFKLTQLILNEVMVNESLPYVALKHAFFFHCERTAGDEWKHNPAACVLSFIDQLLSFNSARKDFFPNFFEGACGPTYHGFKIEDQHVLQNRLLAARQHPFECLYFAVCSLNPSRSLGHMFNSIIENILINNGTNAYSQCFLPTTRDDIVDLVVESEYSAAHVLCCETPEDLNYICGSQLTSTDLLQQVIYYVGDPIKRWVFALQADFKTKQHFLETVLVDQDVVPISGIYGRMVDDILSSEIEQQVLIPGQIIEPKKFFLTTRELVKFMKQQQFESSVIIRSVMTGIIYIIPRLQEVSYGSTDTTANLDAKEAIVWDMGFLMQDVNDVMKEQHTRPVNDLHMPVLQKIINLMTLRKRSGPGQTRQNRRENAAALLKNFISIMSSMSQGGTELPMYSD